MGKNVIQVNGGITINVDVSVNNIIYVKKIIFEILLHVAVKIENIQQVLWMIQQYIEDAEAKSYHKTSFNEKKPSYKTLNFYVLLAFLIITIAFYQYP